MLKGLNNCHRVWHMFYNYKRARCGLYWGCLLIVPTAVLDPQPQVVKPDPEWNKLKRLPQDIRTLWEAIPEADNTGPSSLRMFAASLLAALLPLILNSHYKPVHIYIYIYIHMQVCIRLLNSRCKHPVQKAESISTCNHLYTSEDTHIESLFKPNRKP